MKTIKVTFIEFAEKPLFFTWEYAETIPDSVTPEFMSKLVCHYRRFLNQKSEEHNRVIGSCGNISDSNITELIKIAYRASFLTDEGRPIRLRIVIKDKPTPPQPKNSNVRVREFVEITQRAFECVLNAIAEQKYHAFCFQTPILLSGPKVLAKLSPVIHQPEGGITISESQDGLFVTGMANLESDDVDWSLEDLPRNREPSAGLLLEILGPGHLRVREHRAEFTLFADQLIAHSPAHDVSLVRRWLHELSQQLLRIFESDSSRVGGADILKPLHLSITPKHELFGNDLAVMITRILRTTQMLGHGGTIAVIPKFPIHEVDTKYTISAKDLGRSLLDVWNAHACVLNELEKLDDAHALKLAADSKRSAVQTWLTQLRTVGQFAAADGCVLLDRNMILHGFGGNIKDIPPSSPKKRCVMLPSNVEVSASELLKPYGTRHASAYALCHEVPHSIAFVLSQDGDLRVFASDDTTVYFTSGLHP